MNFTAKVVPESQRLDTADKHFGIRYRLLYDLAMAHPDAGAIRAAIDQIPATFPLVRNPDFPTWSGKAGFQ